MNPNTKRQRPARRLLVALGLILGLCSLARAGQYTLFLYESKADFADRTNPDQAAAYWGRYGAYAKMLGEAGVLRGGTALYDDARSNVVRLAAKQPTTTPGAQAVSKEQLGGYFVIEVADLSGALQWAEKAPALLHGAVEVRPHYLNPSAKPTNQP